MVSTYSPHREVSYALHLSPRHMSQVDTHSAIREIRRSLSRSPSKTSEFRPSSLRSLSPATGNAPFLPSPLSPSGQSSPDSVMQPSGCASPNPNLNRAPQSIRLQRPTLRRTPQTQSLMRIRTSPKSPSKRALAETSDGGNSSPMPLRKRTSTEADREDYYHRRSGAEDKENEGSQSSDANMDKAGLRVEKRRSGGFQPPMVPHSPMKRHDGPMNIDSNDFGSPSAKRRSLHGPPQMDFSIFESDSALESFDRRAQDDNDWHRHASPLTSSRFSTIPKRSSSLRKSTLQQRQSERPGHSRLNQLADIDFSSPAPAPAFSSFANLKDGGNRLSLDNHVLPMPRDSPFSSQGSLLNASIHPVPSAQNSQSELCRHPLSRTMTQSSSTTSVQDDSPTHEPLHRPDRPKSHDFSKSLPIGATRPTIAFLENNDSSSQNSFATPANYKSARPLPAAFMSTGLISKKNRNVDEPNGGLPKAHMPDTPCKKQPVIFPGNVKAMPSKLSAEHRHSFGTPSTPFNPNFAQGRKVSFQSIKGNSIFGSNAKNANKRLLTRKSSFASIDEIDKHLSQSPTSKGDSQSTDSDFPPTPTKHAHLTPSPNHGGMQVAIAFGSNSGHGLRFTNGKLSPIEPSPESLDGDSDGVMEDSPPANLRLKSSLMAASELSPFTRARVLQNLNCPTPLSSNALAVVAPFHSPRLRRTKFDCLSPVSPKVDRASPHTPLESVFPPDPSGLSISGRRDRANARPGSSSSYIVPATPTGPREYFPNFSNRPSLNLNAPDTAEVDQSLAAKFERVELVGTGEFSQVYRVSQPPETSPGNNLYSLSSARSSSRSSLPERIWAVKKSRYPYAGVRDRLAKIHEVEVLKRLGHSDHILAFVDSWEEQGHLYIQTEFCEEGTLDVFLAQVGLKARLDDFRIWKILLELSLGLKHIHENGFIHLDLKPANVLITFEGVLKIADFGMATKWPAKAGIEGEGDREYIGPEILRGNYDKPADIFALGLMMLETAGNVELPDNGASWQKLRNGDMSDVPSLTWSTDASNIFRDASGNPLPDGLADDTQSFGRAGINTIDAAQSSTHPSIHAGAEKHLQLVRSGELLSPPAFMTDAMHEQALDRIVRWMISPDPTDRPLAIDILQTMGVQWAEARRRAGATVFEGNWGPADEILQEDAEMIDV